MTDTQKNMSELIANIIDLRIRPVLQAHGGDIAFRSYEDGILYVELQGACNGCPGALNTLKNNVEGFLKIVVPELKEVRDVNLEARQ